MSSRSVLLVSPLPPSRCGVASYAGEHLARLRAEKKEILTISMMSDSTADLHVDFSSPFSCLRALWKLGRCRFEEVIVHYADIQFFPWRVRVPFTRGLCRILQSWLCHRIGRRSRHSVMVIHEMFTSADLPTSALRTREYAFSGFDEIAFHTDSMRQDFLKCFPRINPQHTTIIEHARFMCRKFHGTRTEARSRLGLPANGRVLLCLGFIHEAKGFHDAVTAFIAAMPGPDTSLHLVGNIHEQRPSEAAYAESLRRLCSSHPGLHLHEGWLDDVTFDTWLAAADLVLLPYLGVTSSGVGARASIYGTPLIIRNLPNLTEQFPDARVFHTLEEFADQIHKVVCV